jgi:hypothetical protein
MNIFEELRNLVITYIFKFSSKFCCFCDVKDIVYYIASFQSVSVPQPSRIETKLITSIATWADSRASILMSELDDIVQKFQEIQKTDNGKIADHTSAELRENAVELLCSVNKLFQISFFIKLKAGVESEHVSRDALLSLYFSTKPICAGGIGGEREVQPGDELFLFLSATLRQRLCPSLVTCTTAHFTAPPPSPSPSPSTATGSKPTTSDTIKSKLDVEVSISLFFCFFYFVYRIYLYLVVLQY